MCMKAEGRRLTDGLSVKDNLTLKKNAKIFKIPNLI